MTLLKSNAVPLRDMSRAEREAASYILNLLADQYFDLAKQARKNGENLVSISDVELDLRRVSANLLAEPSDKFRGGVEK